MKKTGKYKVGEKVVFLSGAEMRQVYENSEHGVYGGFNAGMEVYGDRVVTIRIVVNDKNPAYYIEENNLGSFVWDERLIKGRYMKKVELPEGLFEL